MKASTELQRRSEHHELVNPKTPYFRKISKRTAEPAREHSSSIFETLPVSYIAYSLAESSRGVLQHWTPSYKVDCQFPNNVCQPTHTQLLHPMNGIPNMDTSASTPYIKSPSQNLPNTCQRTHPALKDNRRAISPNSGCITPVGSLSGIFLVTSFWIPTPHSN